MSQRKEKYLRKALKEANRLEGVAMELAGMGARLENHLTGTDRRLARNIRDTQQLRDELTKQRRRIRRAHRAETFPTRLACAAFILAAVALLVAITRTTLKEEAKTPADSRAYVTVAMTPIQAGGLADGPPGCHGPVGPVREFQDRLRLPGGAAGHMGPKRAAELREGGTYETQYSRAVMERAEVWAEILPADASGAPSC